jgi:hypothetical protein
MPYNNPGARVSQIANTTANIAGTVTLPTAIVGPLYEIKKLAQSTEYDPFAVTTTFTWPDKRSGTVVDLGGTRNGFYDSQRLELYDYPAEFYVKEGETYTQINYDHISDTNQTGFTIGSALATGITHGNFNFYVVDMNNELFGYLPTGGIGVSVGDGLVLGVSTDVSIVTGSTSTKVYFDVVNPADVSAPTVTESTYVFEGGGLITVTPSATAGRIIATMSVSDFSVEVAGLSVGDVSVSYMPISGFTSLQGLLTATKDSVDGITFTLTSGLYDSVGYKVKITEYTDGTYTTVSDVYFSTIVSVNTSTGIVEIADALTAMADDAFVTVTILRGQVGYVEAISDDNTQLTIVAQTAFSDSLAVLDFYTSGTQLSEDGYNAYPFLDVYVTYRSSRKDIADQIFSASTEAELLTEIDHSSIDYRDGLGFAVRAAINAQPTQKNVIFIPVDIEPDSSTGLPANKDLVTGYTNALETLEATSAYNVVQLDKSTTLDALLTNHVAGMSTEIEGQFRRGFLYQNVPLGDVESTTGVISPGNVATGVAATTTSGNKIIKDDSVAFITDAEVVAGTKVVVTSPAAYAGEYTASADTTDSDLILEGADWEITKESLIALVTVDTVADSQVVTSVESTFLFADAGDYIEVTISAIRYRLKVVSINALGTVATCVDEVAGALDFGTGNSDNGSDATLIRSWGATTPVSYYIRPLTKSQMVTKLIASKAANNRRISLSLNYAPSMAVDVDDAGNDVYARMSPSISLAAMAAKRSGQNANQEATNLFLGAGIESPTYAFNFFKPSQLNLLAENGFLLIAQNDDNALPYIRDMITSTGLTAGLVEFEEMVVSIGDWISKILKSTFALQPGQRPKNLTPALLGLRAAQTDILFRSFVGNDYLVGFKILTVEQDAVNKRQTNIVVEMIIVVAEKEIRFTLNTSV